MVKQFLKKKSKRQTTKHRVKVEKKIKEHKRKLRKEAKKNPKKVKRKDPGIPNNLPFREEIMKEMEAAKDKREQEREKKKLARQKARDKLKNQNRNASIVRDAEKQQAAYDRQQQVANLINSGSSAEGAKNIPENSRKAFYKEVSKVIDAADVILEVLDARDPLGSRCSEMEELVKSSPDNKRLVLVLNKIDLVPRDNVQAWLKHLRLELPAVAFKASTQSQRDHLTQSKISVVAAKDEVLKSSHCLGADVLMKLLKNYTRGSAASISVGVVGFPNTGKSSLINSLKRSKACDVGAVPGVTRAMQSVQLDKHIKLLDSPGVVLVNSPTDVAAVLRNVVKLENLDDPVPCVEAILSRCQKTQMMLHYNIGPYSDTTEFLSLLARRLGKLRKGGVPDVNRAARTLLQDWNSGKITYYTAPPERPKSQDSSVHLGASIVSGWAEEFKIDEIQVDEQNLMATLSEDSTNHMLVTPLDPLSGKVNDDEADDEELEQDEEEEDDEEDMEDEENAYEELKGVSVKPSKAKTKGKASLKAIQPKVDYRHKGPPPKPVAKKVGGLMTKKANKLLEKKMRKKKKKADAMAGKLSASLENAFASFGQD